MVCPSLLKATAAPEAVCPLSTASSVPLSKSQILKVRSVLAVARRLPSWENAREMTWPSCALKERSCFAEAASHKVTVTSWAVTRVLPSGWKSTQSTQITGPWSGESRACSGVSWCCQATTPPKTIAARTTTLIVKPTQRVRLGLAELDCCDTMVLLRIGVRGQGLGVRG